MNFIYGYELFTLERSASSDAEITIGVITTVDHTVGHTFVLGFHQVLNIFKFNQTFMTDIINFQLIIDFPRPSHKLLMIPHLSPHSKASVAFNIFR